jgi:hypothetical protein
MTIEITVFWGVKRCSLVDRCRSFGGKLFLHL